MNLLAWLFGSPFDGLRGAASATSALSVNPASGLPMAGDSFDVAGNPYGTDSNGICGIDDTSASDWDWSTAADTSCAPWD